MRVGVVILAAFAGTIVGAATGADSDDALSSDVLARYLCVSHNQQTVLRGVQMDVDIDAELPKLNKTGKLHALRSISKVGKITYKVLGFSGDTTIKNDVISKYLTAENQAADSTNMAVTPANYKFKYKGLEERAGHQVHIFQVTPKKKRVGLFKGELWVDAVTSLPVREAGRFVKNPSIFLKKVEFVRDYEIREGMAIPRRIESLVDTRLVGPAKLIISYTNFSKQEGDEVSSVPTVAQ